MAEIAEQATNTNENTVPEPSSEVAKFELPVPAMEHLLRTWQSAREELEQRKQEYERALKREEMVFEAFKKGMMDTMNK